MGPRRFLAVALYTTVFDPTPPSLWLETVLAESQVQAEARFLRDCRRRGQSLVEWALVDAATGETVRREVLG